MRSKKENSYKTGLRAEFLAKCFLRLHGFRIKESRYITGKNTNRAEIDIIAQKKNLLVFVEVKSRPNIEKGWEAISNNQITRLRLGAENYISKKHWTGDARYDVIIVCKWRIYWVRGAI